MATYTIYFTRSDNLDKGLISQRRNLIGISLILFFYQSSKIVLSTINILGNDLDVKDPSRVSYALWIAWTYFLLRYYQHYRYKNKDDLNNAIMLRMHHYIPKFSLNKFKKSYDPEKDAPGIPLPHEFDVGQCKIERKDQNEWLIKARITVLHPDQKSDTREHDIRFKRFDLLILKLRAYVYVALHTPLVTEYHLPFAVASVPIFYLFFSW